MGRNPTTQDVFRLMLLAPDFLEVGRSLLDRRLLLVGKEQATALIRGALGCILIGVLLNSLFGDEDTIVSARPFTFVTGVFV